MGCCPLMSREGCVLTQGICWSESGGKEGACCWAETLLLSLHQPSPATSSFPSPFLLGVLTLRRLCGVEMLDGPLTTSSFLGRNSLDPLA